MLARHLGGNLPCKAIASEEFEELVSGGERGNYGAVYVFRWREHRRPGGVAVEREERLVNECNPIEDLPVRPHRLDRQLGG